MHAISRAEKKLTCYHMLSRSQEETERFHGSFPPPLRAKVGGEFFPEKVFHGDIFSTNLWEGANLKVI